MLSIGDLSSWLSSQALNALRSERLWLCLPGCAVMPAKVVVFTRAVFVSAVVVAASIRELAHPLRVPSLVSLPCACTSFGTTAVLNPFRVATDTPQRECSQAHRLVSKRSTVRVKAPRCSFCVGAYLVSAVDGTCVFGLGLERSAPFGHE